MPVNIQRLIQSAKKTFKLDPSKPSELQPADVVRKVRELLKELVVVGGDDGLSVEAQKNATYNFFALLRSSLWPMRRVELQAHHARRLDA